MTSMTDAQVETIVFPELPEGYYWEYVVRKGGLSYGTLYMMKERKNWFDKLIAKSDLYIMYSFNRKSKEYNGVYEPGTNLLTIAEKMVYDKWASLENVPTSFVTVISDLPRSEGTETLLDAIYAKNAGKHKGGAPIACFGDI